MFTEQQAQAVLRAMLDDPEWDTTAVLDALLVTNDEGCEDA
jgi:hypothetical protein